MNLEVMQSEKGKPLIVINNFKYRFQKNLANEVKKWVCSVGATKKCPAFLKTIGAHEIIELKGNHNHDAVSDRVLDRQKMSNSLKRKASDDITERPSKIIHKELSKGDVKTFLHKDIQCISRNISAARKSALPFNIPKTREEVHRVLESLDLKTNKNENFLLYNNDENGIVIFGTKTNLEFLTSLDSFYVDGTFKSCTNHFLQLFTIHGLQNNYYIPLLYILLPDKKTNSYLMAFQNLINLCNDTGKILQPKSVVADFELAIHQSVKQAWPEVVMIGCRFHLGQAWFRKLQKLGLASHFKNKEADVGKFLTYTFGLQFLPPDQVGDCFAFDMAEILPADEKVNKYCDYLTDFYVDENSVFPPQVWASSENTSFRTTNACESFHARFNQSFYTSHPNIFLFTKILLNFQSETYIKMRSSLI